MVRARTLNVVAEGTCLLSVPPQLAKHCLESQRADPRDLSLLHNTLQHTSKVLTNIDMWTGDRQYQGQTSLDTVEEYRRNPPSIILEGRPKKRGPISFN